MFLSFPVKGTDGSSLQTDMAKAEAAAADNSGNPMDMRISSTRRLLGNPTTVRIAWANNMSAIKDLAA